MAESYRAAGYYELKSFKITSFGKDPEKEFEIKGLIHTFEISESISTGSVRGLARLHESYGLLRGFPLRGEEFIEIVYEDFYEVERTEKFFLYSITNVQPSIDGNDGVIAYTIHFVSVPKVYTEDVDIRRAYRETITDNVVDIFNEFYKPETEKELTTQSTDGVQTLIVPHYKPEQAMYFMARRGYNAESFSQTFRFFENRDRYIFATDEYIQLEIYNKEYRRPHEERFIFGRNYIPDSSPQAQGELQQALVHIEYPMLVNTIEDITEAGYLREYSAYDLLGNTIEYTEYDIRKDFDSNNNNKINNEHKIHLFHSKKFQDEFITTPTEKWFIKDYATEGTPTGEGIRQDTRYAEIHNRKHTHFYHTNRNKTNITIHGNNNIFAGSVIYLNLMLHEAKNDTIQDEERSGYFIVESITNVFYEDKYMQQMTLIRNGVGISEDNRETATGL